MKIGLLIVGIWALGSVLLCLALVVAARRPTPEVDEVGKAVSPSIKEAAPSEGSSFMKLVFKGLKRIA